MQAVGWFLLLAVFTFHCHVEGKQKPVTVRLEAKWPSTPVLCEVRY